MNVKTRVLVRLPANTVDQGLRIDDRGVVDVRLAKIQHAAYCKELKRLGYSIEVALPPDDVFPDSVFVEDPALIVEDTLIVTRLKRPERRGEELAMEAALKPFYGNAERILDTGFVEGGDVLVTDGYLYIGISKRTDWNGAEQLARIAHNKHRYRSVFIFIPDDHLHLKGEVSYHRVDRGIITVSERLAPDFKGTKEKLVIIPAYESKQRFGANCISKDRKILVHAGCVQASKILKKEGFEVREVDLSEYDKIDGAMSCMSKFF